MRRRRPEKAFRDRFLTVLSTALLCLGTAATAAAASQSLADARRLLAEGKAAEAYTLLAADELAMAGSPAWDYLFGVAALDSGRHAEAVSALERVIAVEPGLDAARVELGRALYESGDRSGARAQFSFLTGRPLPASTRSTVDRYLAAIDARPAPAARRIAWLEFGAGHDSNANASTSDPDFFGVILDPKNVRQSSGFGEVAAGIGVHRQVRPGSALSAGVRIGHRANFDASFVDQTVASVDAAWTGGAGQARFTIAAGGYYGLLDGDSHEWGAGLDLAVALDLGDGWTAQTRLHGGLLRYEDLVLRVFDVTRVLGALTIARGGIGERAGYFSATAFGGGDDPRHSGSAYGNDRVGLRLLGGLRTGSRTSLWAEASWQDVDYEDAPGFFGADREDSFWDAALGLGVSDWPARGFSLRPSLRYSRNDSNIPLYDYDRFELRLSLRRSFR